MKLSRKKEFMLFGTTEGGHSWKGVRLFFGVYLGVMLFSAIVSPFVYWGVGWWNEHFPSTLSQYLINKSFDDYFDRIRWLPLVVGFPWIFKYCGLFSLKNLGVTFSRRGWQHLVWGFQMGAMILCIIIFLQILGGGVGAKGNPGFSELVVVLVKCLGTALVVSFLEEIVFRGLVLRIFYTAWNVWVALLGSAAFFAYVHFKMPSVLWDSTDQVVTWGSGFYVGLWTLLGITQDFQLLMFCNLLMLGVLTGLLFLRTGSLMMPIGLHTGLVTVILTYQKFYIVTGEVNYFWGSQKVTDGVLALLMMAMVSGIVCFWRKDESK